MININAIIFDLGGVLLNLNQQKTIDSMLELGVNPSDINFENPLFTEFETGTISTETFITNIKELLPKHITTTQIVDAWNAMLLDIPNYKVDMLVELKKYYNLYLFSNTNQLHITWFNQYFKTAYPKLNWHDLFETTFYSFELGARKPHTTAFEKVIEQAELNPKASWFFDDNLANVEGAKKLGINTHYLANVNQRFGINEVRSIIKQA